ncbi:MAG: hypothetical protein ACRC92_21575 [Peptostreptococcaceae bacterium]
MTLRQTIINNAPPIAIIIVCTAIILNYLIRKKLKMKMDYVYLRAFASLVFFLASAIQNDTMAMIVLFVFEIIYGVAVSKIKK